MSRRFAVCLFVISCLGSTTTVPKVYCQSVGLDRVLTGVSAKSLPVNFVNNLIVVTPVTVHGDTLRLYTDTGGGTEMIYPETVDKIEFEVFYDVQDGDSTKIVAFPPFKSEASIPLPNLFSSYGQFLYVPDEDLAACEDPAFRLDELERARGRKADGALLDRHDGLVRSVAVPLPEPNQASA